MRLRFTNAVAQLFVAAVDLHAHALGQQHRFQFFRIVQMPFVMHRNDDDLLRRQPHRESTSVMFDQNADKALDRAEDDAVQHDWTFLGTVRIDISQIEAFRQIHIQLDRAALPDPSQAVR